MKNAAAPFAARGASTIRNGTMGFSCDKLKTSMLGRCFPLKQALKVAEPWKLTGAAHPCKRPRITPPANTPGCSATVIQTRSRTSSAASPTSCATRSCPFAARSGA